MICKEFRCLFVHVPKVAGQSIEQFFLDKLGLSWEQRLHILLGPNDDPAKGPPWLAHLRASDYVPCGHMSQEEFNEYYKFTFVRDPWSRTLSFYRYLGWDRTTPFPEFVKDHLERIVVEENDWFMRPQVDYICDDRGANLVDFVGRFERLQADFETVCRALGLEPQSLPRRNITGEKPDTLKRRLRLLAKRLTPFSSKSPTVIAAPFEGDGLSAYYDDHLIKVVGSVYKADVERFNFEYTDHNEKAKAS